jgi:predicted transcriptional regulator
MTSDSRVSPRLTAKIVAAFVRNNTVPVADLPEVIRSVHTTFLRLQQPEIEEVDDPARPMPAVPIRKSVHPDYIICLEDGKKMKMLKRHLMTRYNMSPDEYRAKWGLGKDYPMVAPNYAKARAETARRLGLGRKRDDEDEDDDNLPDGLEDEIES